MFCLTQQTWGIHPMLFQWWANIETALGECLVFAVNMSVSSVNTIGLTQCWFNVGPSFATLDQYLTKVGSAYRVDVVADNSV